MKVIQLEQVDSTNNFLKNTFVEDQLVFVYTKNQTNGKGYYGNKWMSKEGDSLTFSFSKIIKKTFDSQKFNFWLSVKVAFFLKEKLGVQAKLKWPNDLIVKNKKIGLDQSYRAT